MARTCLRGRHQRFARMFAAIAVPGSVQCSDSNWRYKINCDYLNMTGCSARRMYCVLITYAHTHGNTIARKDVVNTIYFHVPLIPAAAVIVAWQFELTVLQTLCFAPTPTHTFSGTCSRIEYVHIGSSRFILGLIILRAFQNNLCTIAPILNAGVYISHVRESLGCAWIK